MKSNKPKKKEVKAWGLLCLYGKKKGKLLSVYFGKKPTDLLHYMIDERCVVPVKITYQIKK